jgi:hypothetical protein
MTQSYTLQPQPAAARAPGGAGGILHFAHAHLLELAVLGATILRFAPAPFNIACFLALAIIALTGRTGTVMALAGMWFAMLVNPGLADQPPLGVAARYLVIAAAVGAALFRGARQTIGEEIGIAVGSTAAVAAAILVHSVLFSLYPSLSIFKALLWASVSLALVATVRGMSEEEIKRLHRFLLLFFAIIIVVSLAMMPLPEARLRNNVGLQGVFDQPQVFGVFCAIGGAYFFGTALASPRPSWLALGMVALSLQGVMESAARTGGFSMVLGCAGMIGLVLIRPSAVFRQTLPGLFSGRLAVLGAVALLGAVVNSQAVREATDEFIRKGTRADQVSTAYDASRGWIIQDMVDNIRERPAAGIGLGIQSATHLMNVEVDETTGLPVSAPVEKGVMWIALFEELGLLLGIVVFGWILWAMTRATNLGPGVGAASIAFFFTNFGEASFFSPGGLGMLGLIIFFLGLVRGTKAPKPAAQPALVAWPAASPSARAPS